MSALPRTTEGRHGLTAFRLSDVPIKVRRRVGARLIDLAQESADAWGMVALTRAIDMPSDQVYWIPTDAWLTATSKVSWR